MDLHGIHYGIMECPGTDGLLRLAMPCVNHKAPRNQPRREFAKTQNCAQSSMLFEIWRAARRGNWRGSVAYCDRNYEQFRHTHIDRRKKKMRKKCANLRLRSSRCQVWGLGV